MKTRIMIIAAAALFAVCAVARAADIEAYLSTGTVEMAKKGSSKWMPLMPGGLIEPGYTVRCGADGSAVLRWFSGNVVRLAPGATLTIDKISDTGGVNESALNLSKGRIYVRAEKLPGAKSSFQITTPTATAGVRGTEFMAEVSDDSKKSTFAVMDGQILVEAKSITVILDRDFQISVDQDQPPGEIFNIPGDMKTGLQNDSQLVNQAARNMPVVVSAPHGTQPAGGAATTGSTHPAATEPTTVAELPADFTGTTEEKSAPKDDAKQPEAKPKAATTEAPPATTPEAASPQEKPADTKAKVKDAEKPETKSTDDGTAAQPKKQEKKPEAATPPADKKKDEPAQPKKDEKKTAQPQSNKSQVAPTAIDQTIEALINQILDYELINYIVDNVMMQ